MPAPDPRATVFVVDDDAGMRASLAWLLAANGLAGPPLLDALAARDIALPVILLGGDLGADDAITALRPRLFATLPKPCADDRLLGRIRAALAHQRTTVARRR